METKLARAVQAIQSSNYSLNTVLQLQEGGFDFAQLSGQIVCGLVARNFGLGLKILLSCGVKLDCVDPTSGNSPLILLAAEGLCGPVRCLIGHVPVEHLHHINRSTNSVLSLLLARGHSRCGCLEALLQRFSTSTLIHLKDPCNRVILSVADLLEQIKTSAIDRVAGIFKLWISVNFIDLEDNATDAETRKKTRELLLQRTIGPIVKDCLSGWTSPQTIRTSTSKCFQLFSKLLILGRLSVSFLEDCQREVDAAYSIDRPKPLEASQIRQLDHLQDGIYKLLDIFEPLVPLKLLTILCIRRQLQRAMQSVPEKDANKTSEDFIFHCQIEELDLPFYLSQMILLQDDIQLY
ncbi:hypothetical protein ECG_02158 [Echinococcus granulosus]|uniref:Uncharacterized protein n=1 Tax=Echinococcus granulosus TaxID=6210 RepID=U6JJ38_ECHGR|nr:hypothetical protein EGR_04205 [Echinococcus granulosus]EUB60959.1 hypothetical protein EGR_04205 [Echinococcus granulosus]KAH9284747.1 hypothetical protein ECG_02158 [Echinococcus granulosus]CDS21803.1 hypothetical protein EgrG_000130600 [Echinococcus granulosus]